ncbi:penicillin-binding protein [Candidatus Woesebacteria bacterium CG22_combo_CG10-13_8_21_14_all_39_10]|uniref:Penicillin-binding protein n=3 Tax=Candidatus Woeseibacteriota TaxID=1752722 RepID=A0A2M7X9W9_9BACT|nr:MAG: penicillin-binding protein [Candidatus Woesebacteria bacterium CG22_combo_CG10-13_8_21_14_all_39_10]PIZ47302.1 MAG: penicillin-binding protein [Candidatus Woesebacteria bacterium CG_4_10_14_0_2_um_filter_39_14]PJA42962.1 MAG: penicillin-binding protein [Candidatus Woesebacteria bacterium CG_4_9_14_3_um_filter_39_10]
MLKAVKKLLALIGKPFYWALSLVVIALLGFLYLIRNLILDLVRLRIKYPKFKRIIYKAPKLKIELPKLKVPKLKLKPKIIAFVLFLAFLFFIFYFLFFKGLPSPKDLTSRPLQVSTKIYDRNGVLLYKIFKDQNRTLVSLSDIPLHVRLATLAAEDAEFYSHPGFSIRGIIRALIRNVEKEELSGGSTITQQLVKNALLSPEKTITRKIKEIILAMQVERVFTKDQILEMYLNEVSYGGTAYGIKEGAQEYFSKDLNELTLSEAAYLAGLTKSPTKFSPFGGNPELAIQRRDDVLRLMRINKFITQEQEEEAKKEEIKIIPGNKDIKAPHFVMYVRQILVNKYGEGVVEKGGLEVTTTLDYEIQKMVQGIVKDEVDKLKSLRVGNGAAVVVNPQTGEILAMVGSKDYFDPNGGNVNVTLRLRQPGSSIKIVNYSYALSHGFTPATILDDSPTVFKVAGLPAYTPRNYDGEYRGKITLRSALAQSRNIPAVKVLASYGVTKMIDQGRAMGITTWQDPSKYGLSLTLGGGDIKLIDLAQVFATIANLGKRPTITAITQVKNYKGEQLEENGNSNFPEVVDPRVAYQLIDILKDNNARAPEFGTRSYLVISNHPEVAVKTGTSNDLKDNLTLGFNQNYLVAVWVGNNDSTPMSRVASGVTGASPIWNKIMTNLLGSAMSKNWEIPDGLIKKDCYGKAEYFLKENVLGCIPLPVSTPQPTMQPQILEPAAQIEVNLP